MSEQQHTHFGFRTVGRDEKTGLVRGVFGSVAGRYDLMNDLMSAGMHRAWKRSMAASARPRADMDILDLAGGTGDIAFRLHAAARGKAAITIADINPDMLAVGQDRAAERGLTGAFRWVETNAEAMDFPDESFDLCTMAFGIRNVTDIPAALADIHRVLRPGGRFVCMEFSQEKTMPLRGPYDLFAFRVLPRLGRWVAKDEDAYRYLAESIRVFPDPDAFRAMMEKAGFANVRHRPLAAGIAHIFTGWKL